MSTQQIETTLTRHLEGFEIPRRVRQEVRSLFADFLGKAQSVLDTYNLLPELRSELARIADANSHQLTARQKRALLRAYCVLRGDDSTVSQQIAKDILAIQTPEPEQACRLASMYIAYAFDREFEHRSISISVNHVLPVHELIIDKLVERRRHITPNNIAMRIVKEWDRCQALGINHPKVWKRVFPYFSDTRVDVGQSFVDAFVGQVSYSQEPGMKLRLFASPYLFLQAALEPLKRSLQNLVKEIPEDHHGDQDRGRTFVQSQLKAGKTAHCFDLSSATHRFPYSAQLKLLKAFRTPTWCIDIFNRASRSPYHLDVEGIERIAWEAGQPLGTGPSFFAFSLAHHLLVRGIFYALEKSPSNGYALLGDDIVIFDEDVAARYSKVMERIGCEINFSKSVISNDVAEFAGALITKRGIYNVGKFKPVNGKNAVSANSIWTRPEPEFKVPVAFLNRTLDADIQLLISGDLSARIHARVNEIAKGLDPNWTLVSVLREIERMGYIVDDVAPIRSGLLNRFAGWIKRQMDECPQCWPDDRLGHWAFPSNLVKEGLKIMLRGAMEDSATPVWWGNLLRFLNLPMRDYTQGALVRILTTVCNRAFLCDSRLALYEVHFADKVNKSYKKWSKCPTNRRIDALVDHAASGVLTYEAVSEVITGLDRTHPWTQALIADYQLVNKSNC